nr:RNA-directed DNA polymerase, eukaryota [Tanacetum cinerariifolium]
MHGSWKWSLPAPAGFSVASVRQLVDSRILEVNHNASRWNRCVPIKVNIFLWRLSLNKLPSRVNLDRKGIDIGSVLCPICLDDVESVNHLFFTCELAKALWDLLAKLWELDIPICANILEWYAWLDSLNVPSKVSTFLEGVGGDEVDLVHSRFAPYFDVVVERLEMKGWKCLENVVMKCWVKEEDFQDSPDDEEDTRSSHEYLNDLEKEYQTRALLAYLKDSSRKVLKVLAVQKKLTKLNVTNVARRVTLQETAGQKLQEKDLILVKSLADDTKVSIPGVERPWLSKAEAEALKGIIINEPSSAPAKGSKSSSPSKFNSAPAGKLKSVKIKDDPPLAIVMKELNNLKLHFRKNQPSYSRRPYSHTFLERNSIYQSCGSDVGLSAVTGVIKNEFEV